MEMMGEGDEKERQGDFVPLDPLPKGIALWKPNTAHAGVMFLA